MGALRQDRFILEWQLKVPTNHDKNTRTSPKGWAFGTEWFTTMRLKMRKTKVSLSVSGPQHNKTVVCYISTWAVYRPERGSFSIDNFDPNLCTIAIYAFAGLDPANDAIRSLGKLPLITGLIRFRRSSRRLERAKRFAVIPIAGAGHRHPSMRCAVECHYFLIITVIVHDIGKHLLSHRLIPPPKPQLQLIIWHSKLRKGNEKHPPLASPATTTNEQLASFAFDFSFFIR